MHANTLIHSATAKLTRRAKRLDARNGAPSVRLAREYPTHYPRPAAEVSEPLAPEVPAKVQPEPTPRAPAPEVAPFGPEVPVTGALEFGCAFPGCGRTFKTAAGVRGHQRAHKSGGTSREGAE